MFSSNVSRSALRRLLLACLFLGLNLSCASSSSQRKNSHIATGNEYARDGLLREAAEAYQKALKVDSKNAVARRNLGIVLVKLKNYKSATFQLEKIISHFESDFDTNFWLAEALRAQERYAEAIYCYRKALDVKPRELRASKSLAWSYYRIRYYPEALSIVNQLTKTNPNDGQLAIISARIQIKLGKNDEALAVIRKAKQQAKPDTLPYFQSVEGDVYVAQDRCAEAIKTFRDALRVQPLLPGPLLGLGRCHLEVGKTTQGIVYLERAIRIRPSMAEAAYLLGKAYADTDKVKSLKYLKHFQKIAAKDPEWLDRLRTVKAQVAKLETKK